MADSVPGGPLGVAAGRLPYGGLLPPSTAGHPGGPLSPPGRLEAHRQSGGPAEEVLRGRGPRAGGRLVCRGAGRFPGEMGVYV